MQHIEDMMQSLQPDIIAKSDGHSSCGNIAFHLQDRRRWISRNVKVDWHNLRHAANDSMAACNAATVLGAISDGNNPFRVWRRVISSYGHIYPAGFPFG